jgi:hypothetical protein
MTIPNESTPRTREELLTTGETVVLVNPQDQAIGTMEKMEAHRKGATCIGLFHFSFSTAKANGCSSSAHTTSTTAAVFGPMHAAAIRAEAKNQPQALRHGRLQRGNGVVLPSKTTVPFHLSQRIFE